MPLPIALFESFPIAAFTNAFAIALSNPFAIINAFAVTLSESFPITAFTNAFAIALSKPFTITAYTTARASANTLALSKSFAITAFTNSNANANALAHGLFHSHFHFMPTWVLDFEDPMGVAQAEQADKCQQRNAAGSHLFPSVCFALHGYMATYI
ncbi:hypothetical protein ACFX13_031500 [Malus domestica]